MLTFQCSSASRKFLNPVSLEVCEVRFIRFQCSSASRKFLNRRAGRDRTARRRCFSALQRAENSSICGRGVARRGADRRFSALQRAENSSILRALPHRGRACWFQCSSASRKFLNALIDKIAGFVERVSVLFSEPKIPQSDIHRPPPPPPPPFQCSSASRKFLNSSPRSAGCGWLRFQCSSASRKFLNQISLWRSFGVGRVSVLFSEPKIPQSISVISPSAAPRAFQCSSASRKFLNVKTRRRWGCAIRVSVLFSEPKIPQFRQYRR